MLMKCVWGFIAGMMLGSCVAMASLIIAFIVGKMFTIVPQDYLVFWLAALGIPSVIVVVCTLTPIFKHLTNRE